MLLASDDQRELEASLLEIPVGEAELKGDLHRHSGVLS